MDSRIEYENPLAATRPDKVAGPEKSRREGRRHRPDTGKRKPEERADGDDGETDTPKEKKAGKVGGHIDVEA